MTQPRSLLGHERYFRPKAPMPWQDRAACRDTDIAVFYAEPGAGNSSAVADAAAKAICAGCPVRVECLEYALANAETEGVWGGMSAAERRRYWRQHGRGAASRQGQRNDLIDIQASIHGTESSYAHGCRCRMCKDGHASYTRNRKAAR